MKQSISVALMGVAIVAVVSSMGLTGIFATISPSQDNTDKTMQAKTSFLGHITLVVKDSHGNIKGYQQTDNLITNVGDDCTAVKLFGAAHNTGDCTASPGTFDVIALGTGTENPVLATDTVLSAEITGSNAFTSPTSGSRIAVTATDTLPSGSPATTTVTIANTYTAGSAAGTLDSGIQEAGLFDATSGGNLFAHQHFSSVTLNQGDTLAVTWTITTT